MRFEIAGLIDATIGEQLQNFAISLGEQFPSQMPTITPDSWLVAFQMLKNAILKLRDKRPKVLFFDELPWFDTHKSGFISAFNNFWNSWASTRQDIKIVICGSSASWMINKVINNKGGLYNRVTRIIKLLPFNLFETELFLRRSGITLDRYSILQLYMCLGGIPHYLKEVKKGESVVQNIANICFTPESILRNEYQNLFPAFFDRSDRHYAIIKALSSKRTGLTRTQLIKKAKLSSGGTTTKIINELIESNFISKTIPFDRQEKDSIYRIEDEFILFYLKFMQGNKIDAKYWYQKASSPSWKIWSGYAFEAVCFKHISQIEQALGISGVYNQVSSWRQLYNGDGAQIDLLIDRSDRVINLIEVKFAPDEYTISKKYHKELISKIEVFRNKTKTRKSLFLTFITTFGLNKNPYALSSVQRELSIDDLFLPNHKF